MESASLLIGKIAFILENEASSIAAVRDEVDEHKLELISLKSFLIDAEGKEPQTEGVKTWVTSVRDLTCDAENVIDEFLYHIYDKQSATPIAKLLHRTIYFPKNLWYRHRIAKKLQKITKKIKAIPERNERYGVSTIEGTSSDSVPRWVKNKAESSLYIMEDELIGIEDKKQTLMGLLMNGEENKMVVSVVGMGGSGKATLVANTFNNENVKRHFDCYAWITVSQTYVIEDLFKQMIKKFHEGRKEEVPEHLNSMSYEELLEMLLTYLKSKRYLVVLDDVWDIKLWQEIRIPLLNRHHGRMSELRSFLVFGALKKLPSGFKLLRVLDVQDAPIDRFPDELVYSFNLRYLNLKRTLIDELPESIGRLLNLQTLNICHGKIRALPKAISKLVNLRHLMMYCHTGDWAALRCVNGTKTASDLTKLQKLQVLQSVESEGKIIKGIGNMTQLTSLGITNVKASDEMDLCDSLQKLELLHCLFFMASDEEEFLRVNALRSPPPDLRKVILGGKLEKVPLWFGSLHNLTCMDLIWSRLEEDVLPHIQPLPNLEMLHLSNAYVGEKLCFSRGFIKLKHLMLRSFLVLNSIAIEKGAMPNLQVLEIGNCLELKALPQGIEFLANVERLILYFVPKQLIESVRGGMDHPKVQHIPEIHLSYERENMKCHESFSGIHSHKRIKPQKHL
ncbi:hypothetical protein ACFX13_039498 [Malus domestica]